MILTLEQLSSLPFYVDGGGDSMWSARATLDDVKANRADPTRLFIRLSDVLAIMDPELDAHTKHFLEAARGKTLGCSCTPGSVCASCASEQKD